MRCARRVRRAGGGKWEPQGGKGEQRTRDAETKLVGVVPEQLGEQGRLARP